MDLFKKSGERLKKFKHTHLGTVTAINIYIFDFQESILLYSFSQKGFFFPPPHVVFGKL